MHQEASSLADNRHGRQPSETKREKEARNSREESQILSKRSQSCNVLRWAPIILGIVCPEHQSSLCPSHVKMNNDSAKFRRGMLVTDVCPSISWASSLDGKGKTSPWGHYDISSWRKLGPTRTEISCGLINSCRGKSSYIKIYANNNDDTDHQF